MPPEGKKMFCITVVLHNTTKTKQDNTHTQKKVHILERAFVKLKCILPLIHILIGCKRNKLLFEFRVLLIIGIIHQLLLSLWACVTAKLTAHAEELKTDSLHLRSQHLSIITSQYFMLQYNTFVMPINSPWNVSAPC